MLHFDGKEWRGYSYAWNDEQTDAELVDADGGSGRSRCPTRLPHRVFARKQWQFPSRAQCMTCHNVWCDYTLAFNLQQLDRPARFDEGALDNQVHRSATSDC